MYKIKLTSTDVWIETENISFFLQSSTEKNCMLSMKMTSPFSLVTDNNSITKGETKTQFVYKKDMTVCYCCCMLDIECQKLKDIEK